MEGERNRGNTEPTFNFFLSFLPANVNLFLPLGPWLICDKFGGTSSMLGIEASVGEEQ